MTEKVSPPKTIGEANAHVRERLQRAGIESAALDARLLTAFALGEDVARVLSERDSAISADVWQALDGLTTAREAHTPVAHLLGEREFWSLPFKVSPATLVPRPETEIIVDTVLALTPPDASLRLLDLGTGSGCLMLAILSERPNMQGVGVDVSADALAIANENARNLDLQDRAHFVQADWHKPGWENGLEKPFEVVVSNPPYIPETDRESLARDVRDYDPHGALFGGMDGLDAYRAIAPSLSVLMHAHGFTCFEIGQGQENDVTALMASYGLAMVASQSDLAGIERSLVFARKTG